MNKPARASRHICYSCVRFAVVRRTAANNSSYMEESCLFLRAKGNTGAYFSVSPCISFSFNNRPLSLILWLSLTVAELVKERKEEEERVREAGIGVYSFLLLFFSVKPTPSLCGLRSEGFRQRKKKLYSFFVLIFFSSLLKFLRL